jgi:hypothetical protein
MVARHQDDQGLVVHHPVTQVEGRLDAQERHIKPTADERLGEVRRIVTRDRDLDVLQLVAKHMHGWPQPVHLVTGLEADGECLSCRLRGPAGRFRCGVDLRQRQSGMEKGLARSSQFDAVDAADEQLLADLILKIPDLTA